MKHKLSTTLALVILTMALAASSARAQTVANGPYYAPPAWDQTLPAATRFIVLSNFNSKAVLDRETGIVWEREPVHSTGSMFFALTICAQTVVGNRSGWRLPSIQEVRSLIDHDPANTSNPKLPIGHPFIGISTSTTGYWSATAEAEAPANAYLVSMNGSTISIVPKSFTALFWCVRGGQGPEAQ